MKIKLNTSVKNIEEIEDRVDGVNNSHKTKKCYDKTPYIVEYKYPEGTWGFPWMKGWIKKGKYTTQERADQAIDQLKKQNHPHSLRLNLEYRSYHIDNKPKD